MVFQTIPMQSCSPSGRSSPIEEFHTDRFIPDDTSTISEQLSSGEDLHDENEESIRLQRSKFLSLVKYHFQLLRKTLVKWSALYHIYGINRVDIFIAFRVNKHPFDL